MKAWNHVRYYLEVARQACFTTWQFFGSRWSLTTIPVFALGLLIHGYRLGFEAAAEAFEEWISFGVLATLAFVLLVFVYNLVLIPSRIHWDLKHDWKQIEEDRNAYKDKFGKALEKQYQCPDKWLHRIATLDGNTLSTALVFQDIGAHIYCTEDRHFIQFQFSIFNGSVFTLSLQEIKGYVRFTNYQEEEYIFGSPEINEGFTNLGHTNKRKFAFRTPIQPPEIEGLERNWETKGGNFLFDELKLIISCREIGQATYYEVSPPLMSLHRLARQSKS